MHTLVLEDSERSNLLDEREMLPFLPFSNPKVATRAGRFFTPRAS